MQSKLSGWDDTIVALATPPGIAAIGVIRLSGKESLRIVNDLFPSKDLSSVPSHTLHVGFLKEGGKRLDEVVISLFKAPSSYTGEDIIEISCHGSPYIQQQVIHAIIRRGARLAKPGEFTQRAFLNGKLDLTQAEAVADLIASNTAASQSAAINNIRGGFSNLLKDLREQLIQFSSLLELELDFSEEDVEFADRNKFIALIDHIFLVVSNLIKSFTLGNVIKNGVNVAIVGKPNAGKSTLLNTLLNENRAIVSEIPGTTRDTIEEILNINGILFRLIDTAGIREHTQDVIESMGVIRSLEKIQQADIVIYVFDLLDTTSKEVKLVADEFKKENKQVLYVANKTDVRSTFSGEELKYPLLFISAKENTGIDKIRDQLFLLATGNKSLTENVIVTNARHYEALQLLQGALTDIKAGLEEELSPELLTPDIRRSLHYLGEITGEITNEDRLDYIFSKFCIGK
jgi:tRNA modification GTPase